MPNLSWWKYVVLVWMTLVIVSGFLISVPEIPILLQTSRNIFFHVPMWSTMFFCFVISVVFSVRFLLKEDITLDHQAESSAQVGVFFGIAGLLTGSLWARFTWGTWWTFSEPKMNMAAIALLIYVAYFVLRSAFDDPERRAKMSAVYNVFAFTSTPFLFYILPRQLSSLHPGAEGNPAFSEITSPELRYVLYPSFIGFMLFAWWLIELSNRVKKLQPNA